MGDFVWKDLQTVTKDLAGVTITAANGVIGTCVETLHPDGTNPDNGDTSVGNFALCHFLYYYAADSNGYTRPPNGATQDYAWGEVRFYSADQWGYGGSAIK